MIDGVIDEIENNDDYDGDDDDDDDDDVDDDDDDDDVQYFCERRDGAVGSESALQTESKVKKNLAEGVIM
jgi:hypothetical protein